MNRRSFTDYTSYTEATKFVQGSSGTRELDLIESASQPRRRYCAKAMFASFQVSISLRFICIHYTLAIRSFALPPQLPWTRLRAVPFISSLSPIPPRFYRCFGYFIHSHSRLGSEENRTTARRHYLPA